MEAEKVYSMSAVDLGTALRRRELHAVDVTELFLQRAKTQSSPIYIHLTETRAFSEAKASDARLEAKRPLSDLDGVPVAWKDLYDMEGEVTTAASILFKNAPPSKADAIVVSKAKAAGMVSLGKLNMTELAYSGIGFNPHYGTPKNACSDTVFYSPGGSSSGSGAAVGRKMVPIAIGTDTSGSIRVPAAYNGVTGFKASESRYDKTGVIPLSRTQDCIGPLARTVADCAAVDAIFRSPNHIPSPMPVEKPHFFSPQTIVLDELDDEVASDFEASMECIRDAGYIVEPIELGVFARMASLMEESGTIVAIDVWLEYQDRLTEDIRARMDERVLDRILRGSEMTAHDLARLHWLRVEGMAEISQKIGSGFILMPTVPILAPEIDPLIADKTLFHETNLKTLRNTALGSIFSLPGVSMPMNSKKRDGHRATSMLVSTLAGRDDELIRTASILEEIMTKGES